MWKFLLPLALLMAGCYSGSGGYCFSAGTKIQTPNGEINVEDVKVGDLVLAFDLKSRTEVSARVVETYVHKYDKTLQQLVLKGGRILQVTPEHPLFSLTTNNWEKAGSLVAGDQLLVRDGQGGSVEDTIESVETLRNAAPVYNLETAQPGNYFAEGVLSRYY